MTTCPKCHQCMENRYVAIVDKVGENQYILSFYDLHLQQVERYNRPLTKNACVEMCDRKGYNSECIDYDGEIVNYQRNASGWVEISAEIIKKDYDTVYFIRCNDKVKIGMTKGDPKDRLQSLQTGAPYPLKLLASYTAKAGEEKKLHKKFTQYHSHLEWFFYSPAIKKYVVAVTNGERVYA